MSEFRQKNIKFRLAKDDVYIIIGETNPNNYLRSKCMEATMHQEIKKNEPPKKDNNNIKGVNITDLIKYTPNLGEYIKANILTKCGRPRGYEGKYKFFTYDGWIKGNRQYGRINLYHKRFCKVNQMEVVCITSYFLGIEPTGIGVHSPHNQTNKPDMLIDYPTNG